LKKNLKNPSSYNPISFEKLETLEEPDTSEGKGISLYRITHIYSVENSDKEKVKLSITFYLSKNLTVTETSSESFDGNNGVLTGNVYWKYNDFVGNRPDAGADITLYALDSIRDDLELSTTADLQGNYKFGKVPPGRYLLIVRSKSTTDCPEDHLRNLYINSGVLKRVFDFDIEKYRQEINEINRLDSVFTAILMDDNYQKYGGLSKKIQKYTSIKREQRSKAEKIIESLPSELKSKLFLFSGYSNALDFNWVWIEGDQVETKITDFGITCI
jgi:hypothetical protein